jgi:O-antigen ligase
MLTVAGYSQPVRRLDLRHLPWLGLLVCLSVAEGVAITHSYLWAAPLIGLVLVLVAADLPLVPVLGLLIAARILTDALASSEGGSHSPSLNLAALIAIVFILLALGLLLQRRQGVWPAVLAVGWLGLGTAVAAISEGFTIVTLREGVREISVVALFLIVYNSRGVLSLSVVTRLIQLVGAVSAMVAMYQFATHSGIMVAENLRSPGTFVHPGGAGMFFAIAAAASAWRYLELGRRRSDALLAAVCAAGTIATFSLAGLGALVVMLGVLGGLRPGSMRVKLPAFVFAALILSAFVLTPLGSERIAQESSTQITTESQGSEGTSLDWRFHVWGVRFREWEQSPVLGEGLGTTLDEGTPEHPATANVPHNEYLRYLVETGFLGMLLLSGAVVTLLRSLFARRRILGAASGYPTPSAAATLGIALTAGCLVNAVTSNTFLYTTTGYAAAMILAAVFSPGRTANGHDEQGSHGG